MIRDGITDGTFARQKVDLAGFTILGAVKWIPKWNRHSGALSSVEIAGSIADQLIRSLQP